MVVTRKSSTMRHGNGHRFKRKTDELEYWEAAVANMKGCRERWWGQLRLGCGNVFELPDLSEGRGARETAPVRTSYRQWAVLRKKVSMQREVVRPNIGWRHEGGETSDPTEILGVSSCSQPRKG